MCVCACVCVCVFKLKPEQCNCSQICKNCEFVFNFPKRPHNESKWMGERTGRLRFLLLPTSSSTLFGPTALLLLLTRALPPAHSERIPNWTTLQQLTNRTDTAHLKIDHRNIRALTGNAQMQLQQRCLSCTRPRRPPYFTLCHFPVSVCDLFVCARVLVLPARRRI